MVDRVLEFRLGDLVDVEEPNGRQVAGTAEDPVHVTSDGAPDVPLGLLVRLVGLTFLGYVVMTLAVGGFLWNRQNDQRFEDQQALAQQLANQNESLTRRLNTARLARDKKLRATVADLCTSAELRDTVIVNQSRAIAALLRTVPQPPPAVQALIEVSEDGIRTLEPQGEKDCPLPPGSP